ELSNMSRTSISHSAGSTKLPNTASASSHLVAAAKAVVNRAAGFRGWNSLVGRREKRCEHHGREAQPLGARTDGLWRGDAPTVSQENRPVDAALLDQVVVD